MKTQRKRIDELALGFGIEFREKLQEFMVVVVAVVGEVVGKHTGRPQDRERAMAEVRRRIVLRMKWHDSPSDGRGDDGT